AEVMAATQSIAAIGETFLRQAGALTEAAGSAQARLAESEASLGRQAALITDASTRGVADAREAGAVSQREAAALAEAAAQAKAEAESLRVSDQVSRRHGFLRNSRLIIEALDSLAIDFSRVLDPTTTERVMREFMAGDRAAFVKR